MINRLLVANRGEIAVRIIKTARRMGIHSIAVFSSVDKNALHVQLADEAVLLGDAPPAESYLNIEKIMDAAGSAGADAIHSGYGFLAENPDFAARCAADRIIFVGPPAPAMKIMAMKGLARERMEAAGVPVLPGINHVDIDNAADQVREIGYPVLVKPEAGGGGKGMRVVDAPGELATALASSRREALSSFGNDSLMIEKYLEAPRHIEIQVFADSHGNCIHLNERDCSVQRRHQKIIEESPAPGISDALRESMGDAAVAAARAIDYVGAGTVEFLLAEDDTFYFMEMNTRLQVEHPVTEMVTGLDLVAWQLKVAAGEELPLTQEQVTLRGHAMEARVYAEDPLNDFLPASGQVLHLDIPPESAQLRIDNGIAAGDLIGVFYDPMLMKLIARGADRASVLEALRRGVAQLHVAGITTNRDFLLAVLSSDRFRAGAVATNWLDRQLAGIFPPAGADELHLAICAATLYLVHHQVAADSGLESPWHTAHNFRLNGENRSRLPFMIGDTECQATLTTRGDLFTIDTAGENTRCRLLSLRPFRFTASDETYACDIVRHGARLTVFFPTRVIEVKLPDDVQGAHRDDEGSVQAPMSGKIVSVMVKAGDDVDKGTPLVTLEAMKMEHTVYAPARGKVAAVFFVEQDLVNEGTELLEFVRSPE